MNATDALTWICTAPPLHLAAFVLASSLALGLCAVAVVALVHESDDAGEG